MSLPSTIAIDGPAGSGKSSVSFAVAQRLGYLFVDTGAFYRAITLLALDNDIDPADSARVVELVKATHFDMTPELADDGRQFTFLTNGIDITPRLHSPEVDKYVSIIAASGDIRAVILDAQRDLAARGNVIMAGRDIGSVVLPDADLKIYIDASLEKRAERRYKQRLAENGAADIDSIRDGLASRDQIDSTREVAPLQKPDDAVALDTTNLTLEEAIDSAHNIVRTWSGNTTGPQ